MQKEGVNEEKAIVNYLVLIWFAVHMASHHRSESCISPIIQEGLQAHSEEEAGHIRTIVGYLFGSLQLDPGIPKEPKSKAYRLKGGMDHTINSVKSIIGCGTSNITWVKSILKKYCSHAIGETKYILPTAVVSIPLMLYALCWHI